MYTNTLALNVDMALEFHKHEDYTDIQSVYGLSRHFSEDFILT